MGSVLGIILLDGRLEPELEGSRIDILGTQEDLLTEWDHGEVELRKRNPPDG